MTALESLIARSREEALLGAYAGSRLSDLALQLADELERMAKHESEGGPCVALLRGAHGLEARPAIGKDQA